MLIPQTANVNIEFEYKYVTLLNCDINRHICLPRWLLRTKSKQCLLEFPSQRK